VVALDLPDKNEVSEPVPTVSASAAIDGPAILQVLPALGEGAGERGTIDLARHLMRRGWRALVASGGGQAEAELESCGARSFHLALDSRNPFTVRTNIRRLRRLIREHHVDLVHVRSRALAWSAYQAARRCDVPFVTTIHGIYENARGLFRRDCNGVMARGDRVIAVSDYVADHVSGRYGVPAERLRVVRRGIDMRRFDPAAVEPSRVDAVAEQWRVPPGAKLVLVPRMVGRTGYRLLLRAIDQLARRDFLCLIVGSFERAGRGAGEIEGLIGALGLGSVARLVSACDDMPAALVLADVVVAPCDGAAEPIARVAVQAQAMGKPVILTDVGGLGETLMRAATGWLVEPDDADGLANTLELSLAMPGEVRARLAPRARRFVARNFSLEETGEATIGVYRELLEGRTPDLADIV
jgi:glycosyltransferase involved in cell wall biosynthesis